MPNTYDLAGKFAVVTGGARGIGHAIVNRLQASGAQVCIWDKQPVHTDGVTSEVIDITRPDEIAVALARMPPDNRIDILVNDAGYLGLTQSFEKHSPRDWLQIVTVNLLGTMRVTQAVLPLMRRVGGGRIINFSSLAGKEGLPGLAAYSAASAGVIGFTKALSGEVVTDNIFVNCIAPASSPSTRHVEDGTTVEVIGTQPCHKVSDFVGQPESLHRTVGDHCFHDVSTQAPESCLCRSGTRE